ncbi:hypothetical protein CDL15_Pgr010758 [Punica granatum]|uniref:Uncharacterized protein n=1 Tax=Punica granatum TaxID=22663 RepID=A0A218W6A6_PUNGR|nr:hypothetical protein CDL15_Pgr010758 [Punica granatum]PKI32088.1 hypothetical protein CRG98_047523 [Punica granatum]
MHKTPPNFPLLSDLYSVILIERLPLSLPGAAVILYAAAVLAGVAIFVYAPTMLIVVLPLHFTAGRGCSRPSPLKYEVINFTILPEIC